MQIKSMKMNAFLNGTRTLVAIIFPLITYPYISRILGTDNLGKINFANSVVNYFQLLSALGISSYAIREGAAYRERCGIMETFANQVFTINVVFTGIAYSLLGITLFFFKGLTDYKELILIQSLVILGSTLGVEWLFSVYEDYLYITVRTIVIQIVSLLLMFVFVRREGDYLKYALISVIAMGGAYLINFFYSRKYFKIHPVKNVEWQKHMKPMMLLFFNTLAITIYVNSDITILGVLKGDYHVGIYSTSVKIYTILKQVVNALIVAALPRVSFYVAAGKKKEYYSLLSKISRALILVLMPMIVGVMMMSTDIVVLVSGRDFAESGASLKLLSIAIGFSLIASFFTTTVLLPYKKDKLILSATIISALLNLGLNFVLIPFIAEKGAAVTTVLTEGLVMFMAVYYSRGKYRLEKIKKAVWEGSIGGIGIAIICHFVNQCVDGTFIRLSLAMAGSGLFYLIVLLVGKEELLTSTISVMAGKFKKG